MEWELLRREGSGLAHYDRLTVIDYVSTMVPKKPPDVEFCMNRKLGREKQFWPPTVLYSFPGSGNTWLRHLIEIASGYYTGSVYKDGDIHNSGMIGELEHHLSGRTIVIKSHLSTQDGSIELFENVKKCIFLMRNPRDAIVSEMNRFFGKGHTNGVDLERLASTGNQTIYKKYFGLPNNYISTYTKRRDKCETIHWVTYEDIKTSTQQQLTLILQFLGVDISVDRLECLQSYSKGNFKRSSSKKPSNFDWISNMLTDKDKRILRNKFKKFNDKVMNNTLPKYYTFF